jgi:hypothetical protein
MGLFTKKKKTKQVTSQTTTSTPTNPEWVTQPFQQLSGQIGGLSQADPKSFVAPTSELQRQAFSGAGGLSTSPAYDDAMSLFRGVGGAGANTAATSTFGGATAGPAQTYGGTRLGSAQTARSESLLDNLSAYMSPYTQNVVDSALADFDQGAGMQTAQANLDLAKSGAFGGSGAAITKSMLADNLTRGRASTSAGLRDQAFTRGAQLSGDDANRRQQAGLANQGALNQFALSQAGFDQQTGLANTDALNQRSALQAGLNQQAGLFNADAQNTGARFNAGQQDNMLARQLAAGGALTDAAGARSGDQRANLALQGTLGEMQRGIDSQERMAPLSLLSTQAGLLGSLPYNLFQGQTQQSNGTSTTTEKSSNPLGSIGSLAMGLGSLASGGALSALGGGGLLGGLSSFFNPQAAGAMGGWGKAATGQGSWFG